MIFAGLDTARGLVCVLDASGQLVADVGLPDGWWGLRQLHGLFADLGGDGCEVVVGVEQQRGLVVELVAGAGHRVFALSGWTVDLCRLLRSAVEGSEASRAAVVAGLARSLHPSLEPLTVSASLERYARDYRQLACARRYEQNRLRGLLARRTAGRGWPEDTELGRPGGLQKLVEVLGAGGRVGSQPLGRVAGCLAALTDLELRLGELERQLLESLPRHSSGNESWRATDEGGAGSTDPAVRPLRVGRGRAGAAGAAVVVSLSLGLAATHVRPSTSKLAGALAPPPPALVDSEGDADSGLWLARVPVALRTGHAGVQMAAAGSNQPAAALRPVHVEIPAIDLVTPPLVDLGLNPHEELEVPVDFAHAGWYVASVVPGSPGPAVIVGHYDSRRELTPGDTVVVARSDALRVTFLVERVARYPKDRFPTEEVYGPTVGPTLRLITCGGRFDRASGHYEDNLVVFASQPPS